MNIKYDTLVLNKYWTAIQICSWKRAFSLLYQESAKAVDAEYIQYDFANWVEFSNLPTTLDDSFEFVNTVKYKIAVPDLIVLTKYDRLPKKDVKFSRENVFHRDKFTCQYCGQHFKHNILTIDHIIPKSRGGTNKWDNVVTCCYSCNERKADKSLRQSGMRLLKVPTEPKWYGLIGKTISLGSIRPSWGKFLNTVGAM